MAEKQAKLSVTKEQKEKAKDIKEKEYPESISFAEMTSGDIVIGKIFLDKKEEITTLDDDDNAKISVIIPFLTEDGMRTLWQNKMLEGQLKEKGIEDGDVIAIKYFGKVKSRKNKGQSYHNFTIEKI